MKVFTADRAWALGFIPVLVTDETMASALYSFQESTLVWGQE